jgi:putative DNA primase/helicase
VNNDILEMALKYAEIGIPVIPLHGIKEDGSCTCRNGSSCTSKGKHPIFNGWHSIATTDKDTITKWWSKYPNANIGIPTGEKSGWLVLDIDTKYEGDKTLETLEMLYDDLPPTVTAITGSGGEHRMFKYPAGLRIPNKVNFAKGLDTRSNGGLIVASPSTHASGNSYRWKEGCSPFEIEPADVPNWLLNLMMGGGDKARDNSTTTENSTKQISEGSRNNHLTSLAGTLRRKGMSEEGILAALLVENNANCEPPLEDREVMVIAKSISRYEPQKGHLKANYNKTDSGNAERFRDLYGGDLRYCHSFKKWYIFEGRYWKKDESSEITQYAIRAVRSMFEEASQIENEDARREMVKHALRSESNGRLKAMLDIAEGLPCIPVDPSELDSDPWKLNCNNGVVDLKTGQLLPHDRKDFMTKLCPVNYQPNAKAPIWMNFLNSITDGNEEVIKYLQKAIGVCLTGDTSEQSLFILYGLGSNGKSTFINTIADMLGDYARHTPTETIMAKKNDTASNDLARLQGTRLVTAIETEEGKRMAESLVKAMTGGDKMTARFLYGEYFQFKPQFKLFLACNHRPVVRDTTNSIWRRIRLVPFNITISDDKKDKHLSEKLKYEMEGILAWAVQGCLLWQKEGLIPPKAISNATEDYRENMDTFSQFIDECCEVKAGGRVGNKELRYVYEQWCRDNGDYAISQRAFSTKMQEKGFAVKRTGTGGRREWHGIQVSDELILL